MIQFAKDVNAVYLCVARRKKKQIFITNGVVLKNRCSFNVRAAAPHKRNSRMLCVIAESWISMAAQLPPALLRLGRKICELNFSEKYGTYVDQMYLMCNYSVRLRRLWCKLMWKFQINKIYSVFSVARKTNECLTKSLELIRRKWRGSHIECFEKWMSVNGVEFIQVSTRPNVTRIRRSHARQYFLVDSLRLNMK